MIPPFKPYLGWEEFGELLGHRSDAVHLFETEFADTFEAKYALAFPYGRSALWSFFKALEIEKAEVIVPAYTCVVVAHAVVLSGNIPRFVDVTLYDYNMDLGHVEEAINEHTQAIIATHLFGYPLDVERLQQIVRNAEGHFGKKIWVIEDCAHAFGARWKGRMVCNEGDVALFGLNISKMITSIFGGMLTTNDEELGQRLRLWRDGHFHHSTWSRALRRRAYLLAVYPTFHRFFYSLVNWLQEETSLLNYFTRSYHLDDAIRFPPDHLQRMDDVEAQVGVRQLKRYPEILRRRQESARFYNDWLQQHAGLKLPPLREGATYSHYPVRVHERERVLQRLRRKGVQLGRLIEYNVPELEGYRTYAGKIMYPNAGLCSQQMVNLPVSASLNPAERLYIAKNFGMEAI